MGKIEKITDFDGYNAYCCNNSGMFVAIDYYTVGEDDYPDQFQLDTKQDAISYAKKLNKRYATQIAESKLKKCRRLDCKWIEWRSDEDYKNCDDWKKLGGREKCDMFIPNEKENDS